MTNILVHLENNTLVRVRRLCAPLTSPSSRKGHDRSRMCLPAAALLSEKKNGAPSLP